MSITSRIYAAVTAAISAFTVAQQSGRDLEYCIGAAVLAFAGAFGLPVAHTAALAGGRAAVTALLRGRA